MRGEEPGHQRNCRSNASTRGLPPLRVALAVGVLSALLLTGSASASQLVTLGLYEGTTDQQCPLLAAANGECRGGYNLPISFMVTGKRVSHIRALVLEKCEDFLGQRVGMIELPESFPLTVEKRRMSFSTQGSWSSAALKRRAALGFVRRRTALGYVNALTQIADDTYCSGTAQWKASPRTQGNPRSFELTPQMPGVLPPPSRVIGPALLQECASVARTRPQIRHPLRMTNAGVWPNTGFRREQIVRGVFEYNGMPNECAARYARTSSGNLQIARRGRWVNICKGCVSWGDMGGAVKMLFVPPHPDAPANAPAYNTCAGGKFHKVRIVMKNRLRRWATGDTKFSSKNWRFPVSVYGNCARAAISARRVHKLQDDVYR